MFKLSYLKTAKPFNPSSLATTKGLVQESFTSETIQGKFGNST